MVFWEKSCVPPPPPPPGGGGGGVLMLPCLVINIS